jgi:hypothetical protein
LPSAVDGAALAAGDDRVERDGIPGARLRFLRRPDLAQPRAERAQQGGGTAAGMLLIRRKRQADLH